MVVNAYDGRDLNRAKPSLSAVWSRLKVVFTAALATALLSLLAPAARANGDLGVKCNTGAGSLHLPALIAKEVAA